MDEEKESQMPVKYEDLVIERVFNAKPERVWEACTNPELMKQWWGPEEFTAPVIKMDFREGGKYLNCMRSPEGKDYWSTGVIKEIVPLKKIVYSDSFSDANGNVVPGTYYGMGEDFPTELLVTFTFEEFSGKTRFTLRHCRAPRGRNSWMAPVLVGAQASISSKM